MKKTFSLLFLILFFSFLSCCVSFAAAPDRVATSSDSTWASSGVPAVSTLVSQAQAGNNLDVNDQVTIITNNGTANDGSGLDTFSVGTVTDSGDDGRLVTRTGRTSNLSVTIGSVNIGGAFTADNMNTYDASNSTTITGALSTGGNLTIANYDTDADVNILLTVGGNLTVGGGVWVMSNLGATGANSTLTLNGATSNFGSGVTLFDEEGGRGTLTLSRSGDQSVTGIINGDDAGDGTLNVNGTGNTTFNNSIGSTNSLRAINIAAATTKTADFTGTTNATTITMSGAGKAQFDGAVTATDLKITSTGEAEINTASNIGTTTFTGAGTLDLNANLVGNIAFGASGDGTVTLLGGKSITGTVNNTSGSNGNGTLTIEAGGNSTVSGAVGASKTLKAVNIQSGLGSTATFSSAVSATTVTVDGLGTAAFHGNLAAALNYLQDGIVTIASGKTITGAVNNTSGTDGVGTLKLLGGTQSVSGNIGATNVLKLVDVASGTTTFSGNVGTSTLNFSHDGTAIIASGKSITGNVAVTTNGQGTLTLSGGDQTVSGSIGTTTHKIKAVNIQAATGETATLSGSVNANTITISSAGSAAFGSDIVGNLVFDQDGTATLASGKTLTGSIDNLTSGQGTLTLLGSATLTGNVGSTLLGNSGLKLLTVGNGAVSIDGDIRALAVNFAGDNELAIADGHSISGAVTTTTNNTGTLTFSGATSTGGAIGASGKALAAVNFNGATTLANNIFATTTTVKSGGTVTLSGDATITGNLTNNGSSCILDLGLNTLTLSGTGVYTQNANSKLKISLSDADYGNISASGAAVVSATSILDINVTDALTSGNTFRIIDGAAGATLNVPTITWDSPLFTITGSVSSNDLWINVVRGSTYEAAALNSNAAAVGRAMDNAPTTGDMATIKGQLDSLASRQEITDALDSMAPAIDNGQTAVTNDVLNRFVGTTILRLQDSKVEEEGLGEPLEAMDYKNDVWVQTYGDYAHQDARNLSNGYYARLWGSVVGLDHLFMDGALRLGLAQNFGFSKIRSKDNYGRTSIDGYQTGFYGEYQGKDSPYVFDAVLTYGYNEYDSSRHVLVGAINRTARSEYDGQQFSSYFEGGYKIKSHDLDITPLVAFNYNYLHLPGYTETGADSMNLTVDSQNYDTLQLGTGVRVSKVIETKNMLFTPELRFRYFYAVINDKQSTLASFAGGGTSFETTGYRPAPSSFNLGARFEFFNKKNITVLVDLDSSLKDDYCEAGGSLTLKYSF